MIETILFKKLKLWLRMAEVEIMLQRIESPGTGLGIPDIYFQTKPIGGWIELKCISRFPKNEEDIIEIPFRPGQFGWISRFIKLKGTMFLMCTVGDTFFMFRGYRIKEGYTAEQMRGSAIYSAELNQVLGIRIYEALITGGWFE